MNSIHLYRLSRALFKLRFPLLPQVVKNFNFLIFNSVFPPSSSIGPRTKLAYGGIGVVIHSKARIGSDCVIGQGVTIGRKSNRDEAPVIGDRVFIGPGARLLGAICISSDVIIGANAVVLSDVPSGSVCVGSPSRVAKVFEGSALRFFDFG